MTATRIYLTKARCTFTRATSSDPEFDGQFRLQIKDRPSGTVTTVFFTPEQFADLLSNREVLVSGTNAVIETGDRTVAP